MSLCFSDLVTVKEVMHFTGNFSLVVLWKGMVTAVQFLSCFSDSFLDFSVIGVFVWNTNLFSSVSSTAFW